MLTGQAESVFCSHQEWLFLQAIGVTLFTEPEGWTLQLLKQNTIQLMAIEEYVTTPSKD